jgi:hypothetical protein
MENVLPNISHRSLKGYNYVGTVWKDLLEQCKKTPLPFSELMQFFGKVAREDNYWSRKNDGKNAKHYITNNAQIISQILISTLDTTKESGIYFFIWYQRDISRLCKVMGSEFITHFHTIFHQRRRSTFLFMHTAILLLDDDCVLKFKPIIMKHLKDNTSGKDDIWYFPHFELVFSRLLPFLVTDKHDMDAIVPLIIRYPYFIHHFIAFLEHNITLLTQEHFTTLFTALASDHDHKFAELIRITPIEYIQLERILSKHHPGPYTIAVLIHRFGNKMNSYCSLASTYIEKIASTINNQGIICALYEMYLLGGVPTHATSFLPGRLITVLGTRRYYVEACALVSVLPDIGTHGKPILDVILTQCEHLGNTLYSLERYYSEFNYFTVALSAACSVIYRQDYLCYAIDRLMTISAKLKIFYNNPVIYTRLYSEILPAVTKLNKEALEPYLDTILQFVRQHVDRVSSSAWQHKIRKKLVIDHSKWKPKSGKELELDCQTYIFRIIKELKRIYGDYMIAEFSLVYRFLAKPILTHEWVFHDVTLVTID